MVFDCGFETTHNSNFFLTIITNNNQFIMKYQTQNNNNHSMQLYSYTDLNYTLKYTGCKGKVVPLRRVWQQAVEIHKERTKNLLLHSHFSTTHRAPADLEKVQRVRTSGRFALQMSHRTNPLFSFSTLSCRGATRQHCLSFLCFIETHRETGE